MNKEETADLALLYAIGALTAGETANVDRMLEAGNPVLESEIRAFRETAAMTALALPESSPSPSVKNRLMAKIRPAEVLPPGMAILRGGTGKWRESGFTGIQFQLLHHDQQADLVTQLVRMAAGAVYPGHHHKMDEQCYVLEGSVKLDNMVLRVGDYGRANAQTDHHMMTTDTGCTVLLINCPHDELHV
jgi:anti-sigma factor ChrR (cupin superfamily)